MALTKVPELPSAFHWPELGDYEFEVVGESRYQAALRRIAGDHGERSAEAVCVAHLVMDDRNPHDNKAVVVRVDGAVVGYMSRDDARSFRRRLSAKRLAGMTTTCSACVVGGGTRKNGEALSYGIRLDMEPFED